MGLSDEEGRKILLMNADRREVVQADLDRLTGGETLLALHPELPIPCETHVPLQYTPHYKTLTQTGKANFSRLADAVAEFVDNSIQSTIYNTADRTCRVGICINRLEGAPSQIIIHDNGQGMNLQGLLAFSTYFLTREERGLAPAAEAIRTGQASGLISKFGVGAAQAGFFIGSRIEVYTKAAGNPDIHEFVMDEMEFQERQKKGEEVYRGNVLLRGVGQVPEGRAPPTGLALELLEAEQMETHFTRIILKLRPSHEKDLSTQQVEQLTEDLAQIYHYILQPIHLPLQARKQNGGVNDIGISISCELWQKGIRTWGRNLAEHDSIISRHVSAAENTFDFEVEIKNPERPEDCAEGETYIKYLTCKGRMYYFPFQGGETRPWRGDDQCSFADDASIADEPDDDEQQQQQQQQQLTSGPSAEVVVNFFWQGRLVPESKVSNMVFFPPAKLRPYDRDRFGPWRQRTACALFMDWNCPISNNKLKLKFPEIENWFNNQDNFKSSQVRTLGADLKNWLHACHAELDKEIVFEQPLPNDNKGTKRFKVCKLLAGKSNGMEIQTGDNVRILTRAGASTSLYGVVQHFHYNNEDEAVHWIAIKRCPEEAYGGHEESHSLSLLHPEAPLIALSEWDELMKAEWALLPTTLCVMCGEGGIPLQDTLDFSFEQAGDFNSFHVKALDERGKPHVINALTKDELLVTMEIYCGERLVGGYKSARWGTKKSVNFKISKGDESLFATPGHYKLVFQLRNKNGAKKSRNKSVAVICSKESTVIVSAGEPETILIAVSEPLVVLDHDGSNEFPLSVCMPAFDFSVMDGRGQRLGLKEVQSKVDKLELFVSRKDLFGMHFLYQGTGVRTPAHQFTDIDVSGDDIVDMLEYENGDWRLIPLESGVLAQLDDAPANILGSQVPDGAAKVLTFNAIATLRGGHRALTTLSEIYLAGGSPVSLALEMEDGADERSLRAVNLCELPPLSFRVLDANANPARMGGAGTTWRVHLSSTHLHPPKRRNVEQQTVGTSGLAEFEGYPCLWAGDHGLPATALLSAQLVKETKKGGKGGKRGISKVGEAITVEVVIEPSKLPSCVEILCDGVPWSNASIQAGLNLSGLCFMLKDESGMEVSDYSSHVSNVAVSWGIEWTWDPDDENSTQLPDLAIPKQAGKTITYAVKVELQEQRSLKKLVTIQIDSGPAVGWGFENPIPPNPLLVNASESFADVFNALGSIVPVDAYGNCVSNVDSVDMSQGPTLRIQGIAGVLEVTAIQMVSLGPWNFALPDNAKVGDKAHGVGQLVVCDDEDRLLPLVMSVEFLAGPPVRALVCCPSLGLGEWTSDKSADGVHLFSVISDFKVQLRDEKGCLAALQSSSELRLTLDIGPPEKGLGDGQEYDLVWRGEEELTAPTFVIDPTLVGVGDVVRITVVSSSEDVHLEHASIDLCCHRLNCVTELRLAFARSNPDSVTDIDFDLERLQQGLIDDLRCLHVPSDESQLLECACTAPLPPLVIWAKTQDGQPPPLTESSLNFSIMRSASSEPATMGSMLGIAAVQPRLGLLFHWKSHLKDDTREVGTINITATYTEKRPEMRSLLADQRNLSGTTKGQLSLKMIPGTATTLACGRRLEGLSASDRKGDDLAAVSERSIAVGAVHFHGLDSCGNQVDIPGPFIAELRKKDVRGFLPPLLLGAGSEGQLASQSYGTGEPHFFNGLSVEPGSGSGDGVFLLQVCSQALPHLSPWVTDLKFITDESRLKKQRELDAQLAPRRAALDEIETDRQAIESKLVEVLAELETEIQYLGDAEKALFNSTNLRECTLARVTALLEDLTDMINEDQKDLRELEDQPQRPAKLLQFRSGVKQTLQKMGAKSAVELAYVRDEAEARLLSWCKLKQVGAVVAKTGIEHATIARDLKLPVHNLEVAVSRAFKVTASNSGRASRRSRNDEEKREGKLPLPRVDAAGFVDYAVNLLELAPENEGLRDTLYWGMYGTMAVFKSLDDANEVW
jgi:hypothetical protein